MAKRNPEFFRNDLPAHIAAQRAIQLIEEAGDAVFDESYITTRVDRGWCVAEIARAHVRRNHPKGSASRRAILTKMARLGAPPVGAGGLG